MAISLGWSAEQVQNELREACYAFVVIAENIRETLKVFCTTLVEYAAAYSEAVKEATYAVEEQRKKKALYKINFQRPIIRHQVMCRKPILVKKIIH